MSEERSAIVLPKAGSSKSDAEIIKEADELSDEQLYAKISEVLDRSVILSKLAVENLPDDYYIEWIHDDPLSVREAQALGFEIDRDYAPKSHSNLHDDGTGIARLGDVVAMKIPKRVKEIIDRVKENRRREIVDPKRQREEKEYAATVRAETGGDIPTFIDSKEGQANPEDITDALTALQNQRRG